MLFLKLNPYTTCEALCDAIIKAAAIRVSAAEFADGMAACAVNLLPE